MSPVLRRYLVARGVVMAGNALSLVALPVLVYRSTASPLATALVAAAGTAPYLVLGLPAGALVDRWHRRRVLVLTGALSGLALLSVPVADALGVLTYPQLLAVALVVASLFVLSDAATFGVVPQLAGRDGVAATTSLLVGLGTATSVAGPVVGGVLVTLTSPALVVGLDAVGFLAAAALTATLRWPGSEDRPAPVAGRRLRAEVAEGLRFVLRHPVVRPLTLLGVGNSLAGGAVAGLVVVLGVEQLGLAADDRALGWLFAAAATGTFVASLVLPRLQRRVAVGVITTAGYGTGLVCLLGLSLARSLPAALLLLAVLHVALTVVVVNGIVSRQVVTPDRLQSRVGTTARLIAWGGSPLGAVLGGVVAAGLGTPWALRVAALGLAASLVGALAARLPAVPRLDQLPRPAG